MPVTTHIRNGLRILAMDDGKLNFMSRRLRADLLAALDAAADDADCRAVVLIGNARAFSAGADLAEMESGTAMADPDMHLTLIGALDAMAVPVIAALQGSALGGGLELALGCHYRIAAPKTVLGLPEITLGLIPGAGGTQRLPRAIGLEPALNLMLSGATFPAARAPAGLIDRVVEGDLEEAALAFAEEVAASRPLPRLRDRKVAHPEPQGFLDIVRAGVARDPRRLPGAVPLVDAVEDAARKPFDKGLAAEFTAFSRLALAPETRPFRHAFLAERKSSQLAGLTGTPKPRPIASAAVIGAGTMGRGIAMALAEAGIEVRLLDLAEEAVTRAVATARDTWARAEAKGRLSAAERASREARLIPVTAYDAIAGCDLVVEAVIETMAVKKAVFQALDAEMKPGAILATNTSTLDIDAIAAFTGRPGDVMGIHFFNPANIMKLVELIRAAKTSDEVLVSALALVKRMGKTPVISGVCDGFIGNRMIEQYVRQAQFLVEEGATPAQVDRALESWGMAMGPFRMLDIVGNDLARDVRVRRRTEMPGMIYPTLPDLVVDKGWMGQKTGTGWYLYPPGARKPLPNPELGPLIEAHSASLGLTRRKFADAEIVERCIFSLVNEAAAILAEGIAQRASDIDVAYLAGYGFPRFRGGPMFYADSVGLTQVVRRIRAFGRNPHGDPAFWTPHPLLVDCAETFRPISNYGDAA